ncbi:MAG: hypothetical protein HY658_10585 [Actinobacteria bacterium]|nr:hypothetical protein [Actinomycetota bacterium]
MQTSSRPTRPFGAAAVAVVGGTLGIVSGFLLWVRASAEGEVLEAKGLELDVGLGAVALSGLGILAGILLFALSGRTGRRAWGIVALVTGALVALVGIYASFITKDFIGSYGCSAFVEQFTQEGLTEESCEAFLPGALELPGVETSAQPGSYLVLGGGVLILVGGVLGTASAGRVPPKGAGHAPGVAPPPAAAAPPPPAPPAEPAGPPPPTGPASGAMGTPSREEEEGGQRPPPGIT